MNEFAREIICIGENLTDMYIGKLTPKEITEEVVQILHSELITEKKRYRHWLHADRKDYRIINLSDSSRWALRWGEDEDKFVHIHPAKKSKYTVRVRGLTLKTALLALSWSAINDLYPDDLKTINKVRKRWLDESPVKQINFSSGIGRIIAVLSCSE
jgi:hypothetical protein